MDRRGIQTNAVNIDNNRVMLQYELPLCEIVVDFHDALKTISSGYASFDYENAGFKSSALVKVRFPDKSGLLFLILLPFSCVYF